MPVAKGGKSTLTNWAGTSDAQEQYASKLKATVQYRDTCGKCGARRVDNQIGLESSPEAYVAKLVEVFREVRRVLHPSGTCWIVIGDSYNGSGKGPTGHNGIGNQTDRQGFDSRATNVNGLGPKQLLGIPWRVAFALQADGWILRSEIIWEKKSCMPESVQDRVTRSHEQVFLLAKNASYYYDHIAIMEPVQTQNWTPATGKNHNNGSVTLRNDNGRHGGGQLGDPSGRNKRSVWTLGPESYADAHFATYPTKLVEPCILAGTSAYGCCSKCLSPWARVVEREAGIEGHTHKLQDLAKTGKSTNGTGKSTLGIGGGGNGQAWAQHGSKSTPTGWQPTCTCNADVVPCTVLDPFCGSGTTLAVALKHGRRGLGIDLNESYIALAHRRIQQSQPLLFALEVQ